ncbi:hypothetical protein DPMN_035859 [Dreissena polymorpha]|uniref:Uncharacterized protein n=1 Tax=Dreissena polymorpha TaxID=45954 RepID=A0A9D4RNC3_DREPO|nr:hypothetical protein DPMN_035859 [Dreissena polymorpha]
MLIDLNQYLGTKEEEKRYHSGDRNRQRRGGHRGRQAVHKVVNRNQTFNEHDEKLFASYLAFYRARDIFEEQCSVAARIQKIMMHTHSLLQRERCKVMLDDESTKLRA